MKELNLGGAVVQAYPLTAAQRIHYYTVNACNRKELLNICTGFYLQYDQVDFDVLKECIYQGYEKYEAMRLRFHTDEEGQLYQYLVPTEDRDIPVVDFRDWKEEDAHDEMRRWSRIPIDMAGNPMNEIRMIRMPDHYTGIYMKVHHMTMDSSSIIGFYSYVLQLYCSKAFTEENIDPPKDPRSYLEQLKLDLAYENNSKAMLKDHEFWLKEMEQPEPIYTNFSARNRLQEARDLLKMPNLRGAFNYGDIEAAIKVYDLEKEPSDRLMTFCAENHVPVASLLLLTLRTVFSHFSGNVSDVSVKNAVARRGTLLERQSGGTRIHFFPLRTIIEPETTFMDALRIVQAKENALLRHANYDPIALMGEIGAHYGLPQGTTYECTTLTYQPLSVQNMKGKDLPDINFKSMWYSNGVAMQNIYVTVMHRSIDNGFTFNFEYQKNCVSEDELEKLYFYMCRVMFYGIEDPSRTIGEILDWI